MSLKIKLYSAKGRSGNLTTLTSNLVQDLSLTDQELSCILPTVSKLVDVPDIYFVVDIRNIRNSGVVRVDLRRLKLLSHQYISTLITTNFSAFYSDGLSISRELCTGEIEVEKIIDAVRHRSMTTVLTNSPINYKALYKVLLNKVLV